MTTARRTFHIALVALTLAAAARGATRGTPDEARAMREKAVVHFGSVGREKALADFTAGEAPFRDRDLYVVCVDSRHVIAANGAYRSYVGTSADDLVDSQGQPLGQALWEAARKDPHGSIQYPHFNPVTRKPEDKTLYFGKVADDLICGVGAYSVH